MHRRHFVASAAQTASMAAFAPSAMRVADRLATWAPSAAPATVAEDEDFWFTVQQAFTVDRNNINLNNGSVAPSPRSVQKAQVDYLTMTNMSPSYYVDEEVDVFARAIVHAATRGIA